MPSQTRAAIVDPGRQLPCAAVIPRLLVVVTPVRRSNDLDNLPHETSSIPGNKNAPAGTGRGVRMGRCKHRPIGGKLYSSAGAACSSVVDSRVLHMSVSLQNRSFLAAIPRPYLRVPCGFPVFVGPARIGLPMLALMGFCVAKVRHWFIRRPVPDAPSQC